MPTPPTFSQALRAHLGTPISTAERGFLADSGDESAYDDAPDVTAREMALEDAARVVLRLRKHFATGESEVVAASSVREDESDGRWALLTELREARAQQAEEAPETVLPGAAPPAVTVTRELDLRRYPPSSGVAIHVDGMMPLETLIAALRQLWPELRRRGYVRRSKPLGKRKLALLRFVCLGTPPDAPWRERLSGWNAAYPDWSYGDAHALQSDLRRAEKSLTGRKYGLEWFYDTTARNRKLSDVQGLPKARRDQLMKELSEAVSGIADTARAYLERQEEQE